MAGNKNQRNLKLVLFLTIVVSIGIVLAIFIGYRKNQNTNEPILPSDQDNASISIGKVHQTATKDGGTEWRLTADTAHYMENENRAVFDNLDVVFYTKKGDEVHLTADRGHLRTDSNDIEVEGNVIADNGSYTIETESLSYRHASRILFTDKPVKVSGDLFSLTADTVSLDLNTQKSDFVGNVKGILSEDITL